MVRARDLSIGYTTAVLASDLNFSIDAGMSVAVIGANGVGKSTFVRTLMGLASPLSGSVSWDAGNRPEIGYLAQLNDFDRTFPITVQELVAMGVWKRMGWAGSLNDSFEKRIHVAMDTTGVSHLSHRSLDGLSGGELQRALFARVSVQDAPFIVLDEPFAAVDQSTTGHLLAVIKTWQAQARGVVLVLHDLSSVLDTCSHVLLLGNGQGRFGRVQDVVTPDNLLELGYLTQAQASWVFRQRATL